MSGSCHFLSAALRCTPAGAVSAAAVTATEAHIPICQLSAAGSRIRAVVSGLHLIGRRPTTAPLSTAAFYQIGRRAGKRISMPATGAAARLEMQIVAPTAPSDRQRGVLRG